MIEKSRIEIVKSILTDEIKKNNLNIDFAVPCRITYYSKEILNKLKNKSFKFADIKSIFYWMIKEGGFCSSKEIVVFSDESIAYFCEPRSLVQMIYVAYHELYHAMQDKQIKDKDYPITYNQFASVCDQIFISNICNEQYVRSTEFHNARMYEILADLYAINKTREYLQKNNMYNSSAEDFLKSQEKYCENRYEKYNLTETLNIMLNEMLEKHPQSFLNDMEILNFKKTIFDFFINEDGTIKDVNKIFSNENVLKLDSKILLAFIKTDKMKEAIRNTQLTENTTIILSELLTNSSLNSHEDYENKKTI